MKRISLIFCICIVSQVVVAQCKLTVTVSFSGNCTGSLDARLQKAVAEQTAKHYNGMTFSIPEDCERAGLAARNNISGSYGGCTAHVTILCGGCSKVSKAGSVDVLGVSKGTSFYSINGANEIRDWSNDDMERMLALNPDYPYFAPANVSTGDTEFDNVRSGYILSGSMPGGSLNFIEKPHGNNNQDLEDYMIVGGSRIPVSVLNKPFVSVNMREDFNKAEMANDFSVLANTENVRHYVDVSQRLAAQYLANPQDLTQMLHNEFKTVSGFDVDAIMQKLPSERKEAECQALNNYKQYRKEVIERMISDIDIIIDSSKEKKEIDGAILAYDVYGTDKDNYLQYTNYEKVHLNEFETGNPIKGVADAIKYCNDTGNDTGIHVELYYNNKTNTYVISCAGSDDKEDWLYNNAANALGGEVPQYIMAKVIADAIGRIPEHDRNNFNLEVVGHSLGGGMASIIGLATGIETKTYNAARVPEEFLRENGLFDKVKNNNIQNISAYHTSTDILTSTQQLAGTPAIGVGINIGDPATITEKTKAMVIGGVAGTLLTPGIGTSAGAVIGLKGEGHRMGPMVRKTYNDRMEQKGTEWDRYRYTQLSLRNEANSIEYQTQESILILKGS